MYPEWGPILCVLAHPDDLELMAGGTIARWVSAGIEVDALTLSDGSWASPDGTVMREREEALADERCAAALLGYHVENLGYPAMNLRYDDALVREVILRVERKKYGLLLCPWDRDLHHDHEVASRIALAASRRVPRVLMGQINHYVREVFTPNVFVDIGATWTKKIEAVACYKREWARTGQERLGFLDEVTRYYGRMIGAERAEGFISHKLKL